MLYYAILHTMTYIFIIIGILAILVGNVGVFKFKTHLQHLHSIAVIDILGLLCMSIGTILYFALNFQFALVLKILSILSIMWLSSVMTCYVVAKTFQIGNYDE